MLFKKHHLEGIKEGSITLAFRKWKRPMVKKGSLINTAISRVEIGNIQEVNVSIISELEAQKAGFASLSELIQLLEAVKEGNIYQI